VSGPFGIRAHRIGGLPLGQLAIRFAFGAAISIIAGVVTLLAGEKVGGILLAFPAILPAALTLIERDSGTSAAVSDVRGASVGALAMVAFALTVMSLAQRIPVPAALVLAAVVWTVAGVGLYLLGRGAAQLAGGEQVYLPDVAASEAEPLVAALRRAHLTVATAESCTGGSVAALLTAVPDASEAVAGGVAAYTDHAKRHLLRIPQEVLDRHGAISRECAACMADAARQVLHADVGIGVTGVIGTPVDGIEPGTMFVAVAAPNGSRCERIFSGGGPEAARADAIRKAISLALEVVTGNPG
jgi:nicotinamide-nucleotide amidase